MRPQLPWAVVREVTSLPPPSPNEAGARRPAKWMLGPQATLQSSSRVKRPRGQDNQGQNCRCPKRSATRALWAGALGIGGSEPTRPRCQERINALPRPPTSRHDQRTLLGQGRQGFAERQSPHGRQVRPTIESMTGRRASSIWVGSRLEPGLRMVRTANGPLHMGPFLLRGGRYGTRDQP